MQDIPLAQEVSQYKGTICSHLLLVTGPSGIWGQPNSGQGAAHSPPYLHPGMQLGCIVSWAPRAVLVLLLHVSAIGAGQGKAWCYLHLETGNRGQGEDGWGREERGQERGCRCGFVSLGGVCWCGFQLP